MMWLPVTGLDRHTPMMGLRVLRDPATTQSVIGAPGRFQETIYRPISDFVTATGRLHPGLRSNRHVCRGRADWP
jgi:hypothetical protein